MISKSELKKLMNCFPEGFINSNLEFIAYSKTNLYFILENCETELDVKCKVLEWFSRDCFKSQPYKSKRYNDMYHDKILGYVNDYLGTNFSKQQMDTIYTYLGNAIHHKLTREFVCLNYNFDLLDEVKE